MNNLLTRNDAEQEKDESSLNVSGFLKTVARRHWESKLEAHEPLKRKQMTAEIETHISNISSVVDPIDYQMYCVPHIVSHSKHIGNKEEFTEYLRLIESMAVGYSALLSKEMTSFALIGLTAKARDVKSIEKYYRLLTNDIQSKIVFYESGLSRKRKRIVILSNRIQRHRRSLLRFFRKRRIARLGKKISLNEKQIEELENDFKRYRDLHERMKVTTHKN